MTNEERMRVHEINVEVTKGRVPLIAGCQLRVGTAEVLAGIDEALLTMEPGEKRTLIVPWWLGYGERGRPPLVPQRATLVYELELIAINPAGAAAHTGS
jgi:FKBP-type peptidyl-prolyl cis-trans isomerase 2